MSVSSGWGILKSFTEERNGIGGEDLGRENIQASVKRSNNFDPIGFLGGLNELLFRNA